MEAVYTYKSNWWGFISKRILIAVIAFFVISFMIFYIIHLNPPLPMYGDWMTLENIKDLRHKIGIDAPLIVQYFRWIGDFFTGNWGESWMGYSWYFR
jgi:peptide/nickel transport system permease protein